MKKLLLLFIIFYVTLAAQKKEIVLEDIWSNQNFRIECLISFQPPTEGDYFLIHGAGYENVNVQNPIHVKIALIEANTKHDSEKNLNKTHSIYTSKNRRLHLYNKMTNFSNNHLVQHHNQPALTKKLRQ